MLRQHTFEEVEWDGEVFERQFNGDLTAWRDTPPLKFLADRIRASSARVYGFEVKCHSSQHLAPGWVNTSIDDFLAAMRASGVTDYVIFKRSNYLRQLVSFYVGWQRKRWHNDAGETPELTRIQLELNSCRIGSYSREMIALFMEIDDMYARLDHLLKKERVLQLTYEKDIRSDPRIGYQRLARWLDLEFLTPSVTLGRSNPYPLRQVLSNYEQVAARLRESEYAWMLDDA